MSESYYVTPQGGIVRDTDLTEEQKTAYHGPMAYGAARDMAKLVQKGEAGPTAAAEAEARAGRPSGAPASPWTPLAGTPRHDPKTVRIAVIGAVMFVAGIIITSAISSHVALCNSALGQLGQGVSSVLGDNAPVNDCSAMNALNDFGNLLLWVGVIGAAGSVLLLVLARYQVIQKNARR